MVPPLGPISRGTDGVIPLRMVSDGSVEVGPLALKCCRHPNPNLKIVPTFGPLWRVWTKIETYEIWDEMISLGKHPLTGGTLLLGLSYPLRGTSWETPFWTLWVCFEHVS